ncbi:MAG: GGDEF domain-containing protein [Thiothrix sp.]|nr:MAG: GGDEF domain-containing protein [Thiothrix sp.]
MVESGNITSSISGASSIDRLIEIDRVNMLFARTDGAILSLLSAAAVYVYLQIGQYDWRWLVCWYAFLCITLLGRTRLSSAYNNGLSDRDSLPEWLKQYRLGVLSSGIMLGSISFVFPNGEAGIYQMLTFVILVGITVGALVVLPDFKSLVIYVVTLMGPLVVVYATKGSELYLGISMMIAILMMIFIKFSKLYNDNLTASLRLRYENKALLFDLVNEKNRLDNRLGRILNESSNEVFVINADTLFCLQMNTGAIDNLGYTEKELHETPLSCFLENTDEDAFLALVKPMQANEKEVALHRDRFLRKNGSSYPVEIRLQLSTQETPPIIVVTALDITEREEYEQKLNAQANFDQLTKLPNRHFMLSHIDRGLSRARRGGNALALLYMDLDNFKNINDSLGHSAGDELLKQAAERIRSVLREQDTPARLGGDEFLIMLEELGDPEHAEVVAEKLVESFKQPFVVDSRQVHSTTSVGISIYPDDGDTVEALMQNADTAMYQAKDSGRSHYQFFSQEMRRVAEERLLIANHLRHALKKQELSLVYQPIMDTVAGRIVGAECLVRWHNPQLGQVPPDQFIPIAESLGLIEEIGQYVLNTACKDAAEWNRGGREAVHVFVNLSSQQFRNGDLLACVDGALQKSGLSPEALVLEITESLLIQGSHNPLDIINGLRKRNIRLAMDDFGTGYSSLSFLKRFPLQMLKIDHSFINDICVDNSSEVLVEAIIAMAKSLSLDVIAEGAESKEQLDFLQERGVRLVQGYYISSPLVASEFVDYLGHEGDKLSLVVAG